MLQFAIYLDLFVAAPALLACIGMAWLERRHLSRWRG